MPKPKLTVKQAKLVKGVVQGKTKRQSAKDAGYSGSPETLSVTASEVLKNPNVQEYLVEQLMKMDLAGPDLVAPVAKALKAKKIIFHGKDSNEAFAEEVEDIELQLKGHDRAMKLLNVYNKPIDGGGNTIIFNQGDVVQKYVTKD